MDITNHSGFFKKISYIQEPLLLFGGNQVAVDPRDGLILYGPYKDGANNVASISNSRTPKIGVIGTKEGFNKYKEFIRKIKQPIYSYTKNIQSKGELISNETQRPSFPGFEAVFNMNLPEDPSKYIEILEKDINTIFTESNRRIYNSNIVNLYLDKIEDFTKDDDVSIDLWVVIVSKKIYQNCRIKKGFGKDFKKSIVNKINKDKQQAKLFGEKDLFGQNISEYLEYSSDFHHLLKARANQKHNIPPIQIIVEPKLDFRDIDTNIPYMEDMKAHLAWSLSTSLYYKLGGKPWKLARIREGVCYIGLVFKKFQGKKEKNVCSAAQLFMDHGDGTIFRGNNGLWYTEDSKEFHLDRNEAFNLLNLALNDYYKENKEYPKEIFIHGRASFGDNEWQGFIDAIDAHKAITKLTGIVIKDDVRIKFFRQLDDGTANYGVLRGIAGIVDEKEAYLFSRGFIPRLNTSSSLEIPNPLHVKITRGESDIEVVLEDILSLTKLNYNSCIYADGKPVTLRFSDSIGNILTATDNFKEQKRQFKYYI